MAAADSVAPPPLRLAGAVADSVPPPLLPMRSVGLVVGLVAPPLQRVAQRRLHRRRLLPANAPPGAASSRGQPASARSAAPTAAQLRLNPRSSICRVEAPGQDFSSTSTAPKRPSSTSRAGEGSWTMTPTPTKTAKNGPSSSPPAIFPLVTQCSWRP